MPFCPKCRCEYVPGHAECVDCGVPLIDQLPPATHAVGDLDNIRFVALRSYPTRMYAEMVQEALANEGIPSVIRGTELFGTVTGLGTAVAPKMILCVPEGEEENAAQIADGIVDPL